MNNKDIIGLQLISNASESMDHRHSIVQQQSEPVPEELAVVSTSPPIPAITSTSFSTAVAHTPHDADGTLNQGLSRRDTSWFRLQRVRAQLDQYYPSHNVPADHREDGYTVS